MPSPDPSRKREGSRLQLHDVRTDRVDGRVEARHRLVVDDLGPDRAEAVEAGPHRAAVSAEHADLDVVAGAYGCAMRTGFNGFGVTGTEIVDDEPMASLYLIPGKITRSNVVTL